MKPFRDLALSAMGSSKQKSDLVRNGSQQRATKTPIACLCFLLVSVIGGILLFWWKLEYYESNSQEWMVPLGLVLFATPIVVLFSAFVSDICSSSDVSCSIRLPDSNTDLER
uniref:Transmembrane protein n=1 Tax=Nelumbo nucifera TaxID=4432 RepID=A0A822YUF5_NELNU|nr:TPA_asm: hypothetical protein HUJ06_006780 [Nelumbo nucifera]